MKPRIKKDLLQGLLAYPMPIKQYKSKKIAVKQVNSRVFFQAISSSATTSSRISRRSKQKLNGPRLDMTNKEDVWLNLRKAKNI
jgi:hypothetical protein